MLKICFRYSRAAKIVELESSINGQWQKELMFTTPEIVKSLRLSQGYSVTELASKMGCSLQTIYNWEDGISEPKLSQFLHLCVIVGLSPTNLLPKIPSNMKGQSISDKELQDDSQQSSTHIPK